MKKSLILIMCLFMLIASACAPSDLRDQRENESKLDEVQDALNDTNSGSVSLGDDFVPVHADPYDYMANDLSKFVKVGQYRGLIVTKKSTAVTDDEFEEEFEDDDEFEDEEEFEDDQDGPKKKSVLRESMMRLYK